MEIPPCTEKFCRGCHIHMLYMPSCGLIRQGVLVPLPQPALRAPPHVYQNRKRNQQAHQLRLNNLRIANNAAQASSAAVQRPASKKKVLIDSKTFAYTYQPERHNKANAESCTICLAAFERNCEVRRLQCMHLFHAECIDMWLEDHFSCPICRCKLNKKSTKESTSSAVTTDRAE